MKPPLRPVYWDPVRTGPLGQFRLPNLNLFRLRFKLRSGLWHCPESGATLPKSLKNPVRWLPLLWRGLFAKFQMAPAPSEQSEHDRTWAGFDSQPGGARLASALAPSGRQSISKRKPYSGLLTGDGYTA